MYIKAIELENFQSHERTRLEFEKGLNVITGPSDQGKSAVIRALRWVLYNEPRGTDFIRVSTDTCRVSVELDDGTLIRRERGVSLNRYIIRMPGGEEQVFEGFGSGVPHGVTKAHGMPKVLLDVDVEAALNMGFQLDPPFLLRDNGATRAKAIGRLTGVHVLDVAIRDVARDIFHLHQEGRRLEEEIGRRREQLKEFDDIPTLEERLRNAGEVFRLAEERTSQLYALVTCGRKLTEGDREARLLAEKLARFERLEVAERSVSALENLKLKLGRLEALRQRFERVSSLIEGCSKVVLGLQNLSEAYEGQTKASELYSRMQRLQQLRGRFQETDKKIGEGVKFIEDNRQEIKRLLERYGEVLRRLGKCPVCFSDLDQHTVQRIVEAYEKEGEGYQVG